MILYHGSNVDIKEIDLLKSRPNKDFGQGFYLTEDRQQAFRMAEQKVLQSDGVPIVNAYEFDEQHLTDGTLKVQLFDGYTEEWAQFILANRNRRTRERLHNYDVVIGAIANDKVGVQLFRYMKDYIDLPTLVKKLQYAQLTIQYYFGTEKGVKLLKKL